MEQIPDAPYIREAERWGMPPYDDDPDYTEVIELLKKADNGIDNLIDILVEADDILREDGHKEEFTEQVCRLEDLGGEIRYIINELRG